MLRVASVDGGQRDGGDALDAVRPLHAQRLGPLEVARLLERKVNLAGIRAILEIKETYSIETIEFSEEDE